jgi:hypothetical protein
MLAAATSTPIAVYNRHVSLWYTAGICTHHAWSVIQELATRAAGHHQIKRSEVALQTFLWPPRLHTSESLPTCGLLFGLQISDFFAGFWRLKQSHGDSQLQSCGSSTQEQI